MPDDLETCRVEAQKNHKAVIELLNLIHDIYPRVKIISPTTAEKILKRTSDLNKQFRAKAAPAIATMEKLHSGDVCVSQIENCFFVVLLDDNLGTKTVIGEQKGYPSNRKASTAASVFSRGYKLKKFGIHVNAVSLEELYKIPYDFA